MARHLTDGFDGFLLGKRYLVLDRDPAVHAKGFRQHPARQRRGAVAAASEESES